MKEVAAFAKIAVIVNVDNITRFINNRNNNLKEKCKYFPCHDLDYDLFDCRSCYCPFYNICSNKALNKENILFDGYLLKNNILACEKCSIIHNKNVVNYIYEQLDNNISINDIYTQVKQKYIKI